MIEDYYFVIGVMSGTSLDGIDLVYTKFSKTDYTRFEIIFSETISYSSEWVKKLQEATSSKREKLQILNIEYANLLATVINRFKKKNSIGKIDFIASHGHTILHEPSKGITLQIGDGQTIANQTFEKVVCDFRTQDVKLGGQGAPLVPIGDKLLFSNYAYCINLGGFANISFDNNFGTRIAYDICPVNIVLNYYVRKLGKEYDNEGELAMSGSINETLLEELNSLVYYSEKPPKSLGLEWVQKNVIPLIDNYEEDIPKILRTFVEHSAFQISKSIKGNGNVLYTGGGVFNTFLIKRIEFFTKQRVVLAEKMLIEYKEALIFAFLGVLRVDDKINCLASVTGASSNHSSGDIFYGELS
ncbi:anhydro-N-acetylmuramic acid kinase [Tenacibaculum sp. MAR_2009_124]|uniref:anhydro-N-acetylmuramic acid kinase n=1 Tax=Tenacibaculum sp. MAR_2009_124 TaxID=1250059 RepID=UPI00089D0F81|nr:anhydro-N-acetylmuramic acid kinase [Tenacibaculum sp. MAR_2009_124]SEB68941.1 anhydro-N-acetylmuramic acid kinase [Tenacibaculum sp. MAR_2009_124]